MKVTKSKELKGAQDERVRLEARYAQLREKIQKTELDLKAKKQEIEKANLDYETALAGVVDGKTTDASVANAKQKINQLTEEHGVLSDLAVSLNSAFSGVVERIRKQTNSQQRALRSCLQTHALNSYDDAAQKLSAALKDYSLLYLMNRGTINGLTIDVERLAIGAEKLAITEHREILSQLG